MFYFPPFSKCLRVYLCMRREEAYSCVFIVVTELLQSQPSVRIQRALVRDLLVVSCHCSMMEPDGDLALSGSFAQRLCPVVQLDLKKIKIIIIKGFYYYFYNFLKKSQFSKGQVMCCIQETQTPQVLFNLGVGH